MPSMPLPRAKRRGEDAVLIYNVREREEKKRITSRKIEIWLVVGSFPVKFLLSFAEQTYGSYYYH